jgi:hypothetical protein
MFPMRGAGDYIDTNPPSGPGAGDNIVVADPPRLMNGGAGNYLPSTFSVAVINSELLHVEFQAGDEERRNFRIIHQSPFGPSLVIDLSGEDMTVTPLTPGGEYELICEVWLGGSFVGFESSLFYVPVDVEDPEGNIVAQTMPRQFGILEALTYAVGKELQYIGGVPATRSTEDLLPSGKILRVKSTLGFADSGSVRVEGFLLPYTEKTDTAFLLRDPGYLILPTGSLVMSDVRSIPSRRPR